MAGLIDVGLTYKNRALSGILHESAEWNRAEQESELLDFQEKQKTMQMIGSALGAGFAFGFAKLF